ncbi:MAG TPA: DUF1080 domain-containing protein [Planctomycetota bacterium]|jgi:hypothetical protein|nr:DUF1080 domain-containing protein [Planctomycetota bacterium]
MKRIMTAVLLGILSFPGGAQEPKAEEGFTPLFNGKDLSGWIYGKKAGGEAKSGAGFAVENGTLFCTAKDGGNLFTEREYGDFTLRFEFRLAENAIGGIALRAPLEGDSAFVGMRIQILDDSGSEYKLLRPEQYHGSIYDCVAAKRGSLKPVGEWNSEEITARGRRVTVTVNGQVVVEANLDDLQDEAKLKKHPGLKNAKGHLGILGYGARAEFRHLRIQEL